MQTLANLPNIQVTDTKPLGWFSFSSDSISDPAALTEKAAYFVSLPLEEQSSIRQLIELRGYYGAMFDSL